MTLITKTLQNLGNLCSFGAKEPFMHEMNQFISDNMKDMKVFIDDLCTHPTIPPDQIPANTSINFGREMARVHYFIGHSLPRLKVRLESSIILHEYVLIDCPCRTTSPTKLW